MIKLDGQDVNPEDKIEFENGKFKVVKGKEDKTPFSMDIDGYHFDFTFDEKTSMWTGIGSGGLVREGVDGITVVGPKNQLDWMTSGAVHTFETALSAIRGDIETKEFTIKFGIVLTYPEKVEIKKYVYDKNGKMVEISIGVDNKNKKEG